MRIFSCRRSSDGLERSFVRCNLAWLCLDALNHCKDERHQETADDECQDRDTSRVFLLKQDGPKNA